MSSKIKHKIIHSLIKKENPVILEVGAHTGTDTELFLDYYPQVNIYCFEPDPRNLTMLYKLNELAKGRLNIIEAAVYDEESDKNIFYQANKSATSSLKKGHPHTKNANIIEVKTIRLDNWAVKNNFKKIDLLWIDVQGSEKEVLKGARKILNNTNYIFIEYGETEYEGGITREETIQILSDKFNVLEGYSSITKKGDLVFMNKELVLTKKNLFESKILGFLRRLKLLINRL